MDIELLGQFSQRLLALDRGQSHFRFKSRCVVPAWSFAHRLSCSTAILAAFRQKLHLSPCPKSSGYISASVFSPLIAAKATFALKAGAWFRRGRLLIVSPV